MCDLCHGDVTFPTKLFHIFKQEISSAEPAFFYWLTKRYMYTCSVPYSSQHFVSNVGLQNVVMECNIQ